MFKFNYSISIQFSNKSPENKSDAFRIFRILLLLEPFFMSTAFWWRELLLMIEWLNANSIATGDVLSPRTRIRAALSGLDVERCIQCRYWLRRIPDLASYPEKWVEIGIVNGVNYKYNHAYNMWFDSVVVVWHNFTEAMQEHTSV